MDAYTKFCQTSIVENLKTRMKTAAATQGLTSNTMLKIVETILASDEVRNALKPAFDTPKSSTAAAPASKTKGTRAKADKKTSDKTKTPNWQNIWTSKDRGGRAAFPKDYEEIKKSLPDKTSHFVIMSKLRDKKEKDGGWKKWWEELKEKGENVPKDPPSDRKPKDKLAKDDATTLAAAATKEATNEDKENIDAEEEEEDDDGDDSK